MAIEMSGDLSVNSQAFTVSNKKPRYELHKDSVSSHDFHPSLFEAAQVLARHKDKSRIPFFQTALEKEADFWDANQDSNFKSCCYEKKFPGPSRYNVKKSWLFSAQISSNLEVRECSICRNTVAKRFQDVHPETQLCHVCTRFEMLLEKYTPPLHLSPKDPLPSHLLLLQRQAKVEKKQLRRQAIQLLRNFLSTQMRLLQATRLQCVCPVLPDYG